MKTASVSEIKKELKHQSPDKLIELCLLLAKFKKENKELLTYLLYEAIDEEQFIKGVKTEMDVLFSEINTDSYFYMKKTARKILRNVKKYVRFSKKKDTEVELLLYYCHKLKSLRPSISKNVMLTNIYTRQIKAIEKALASLNEDLQYDYTVELEKL
jgi:hypothetical protein